MQYSQLIFLALLVGVFWFLILRPQQQRQKQHTEMLSALSEGDEIVTIGGIYAKVDGFEEDDRIRVVVYDGSEIEISRRAIAQIVTTASELEARVEPEEPADETVKQADVDPDAIEGAKTPDGADA